MVHVKRTFKFATTSFHDTEQLECETDDRRALTHHAILNLTLRSAKSVLVDVNMLAKGGARRGHAWCCQLAHGEQKLQRVDNLSTHLRTYTRHRSLRNPKKSLHTVTFARHVVSVVTTHSVCDVIYGVRVVVT